jgi:hypothetical protein
MDLRTAHEMFHSRRALVEGVTERCIERELEMAVGPSPEIDASPDGIASMFGHFVGRALGKDRAVTLAHYGSSSGTSGSWRTT